MRPGGDAPPRRGVRCWGLRIPRRRYGRPPSRWAPSICRAAGPGSRTGAPPVRGSRGWAASPRRRGRVIAVAAGRGGGGASVFAAALARSARARRCWSISIRAAAESTCYWVRIAPGAALAGTCRRERPAELDRRARGAPAFSRRERALRARGTTTRSRPARRRRSSMPAGAGARPWSAICRGHSPRRRCAS